MADDKSMLEAHKYGREKLLGLFPRNKNLLEELSVNIAPSQFMIDFGNAQNFMMMGYSRHPKAKKINNNYFNLLTIPDGCAGALYGYGGGPSPYSVMTTVIGDKVAWPKVKNLADGSDIPISTAEELAEAHEGIINQLDESIQNATTAEDIKKAVDITYDNFNVLYKFLTDVDEAFKDSPTRKAKETLQQGVEEVNRLLGEAEQKLYEVRVLAMKMSAGRDAPDQPDEPDYDIPDFESQYEEKRQRELEAQKNFDPIRKVFAPAGFTPEGFGNPLENYDDF